MTPQPLVSSLIPTCCFTGRQAACAGMTGVLEKREEAVPADGWPLLTFEVPRVRWQQQLTQWQWLVQDDRNGCRWRIESTALCPCFLLWHLPYALRHLLYTLCWVLLWLQAWASLLQLSSVQWMRRALQLVSISRLLVAPKALLNLLTCYQRQEGLHHWVLSRVPPNIQALHNSPVLGPWTAKDVELPPPQGTV